MDTRKILMQLDHLYADGVAHRNALIKPMQDFSYIPHEQLLIAWKERVLWILSPGPVRYYHRIRTLNVFEDKSHKEEGKDPSQCKLESIWTETLDRLSDIIEEISYATEGCDE